MKRTLLCFIIICSGVVWCHAADRMIEVNGNRKFSDRDILRFGAIENNSVVDSVVCRRIQDSLIAHDYLFATVSAKPAEIVIAEGNLGTIESIRWLGDSAQVPARIHSQLLLHSNGAFHWSDLRSDLRLILDALSNVGFPFASVELERLLTNEQIGLDVWIRIRCGAYTEVEFVDFSGAVLTSQNVLRRVARVPIPSKFDERSLQRARDRLRRLDFIESVSQPELVLSDDGRSGVSYRLREASATRVDAIAGLVPKPGGNGSELTGLVHLNFLNLFGTGRTGKVFWDRPNAKVQAVEIAYREPWVLRSPVALSGQFSQRVEDTLYVSRVAGLSADVELGRGFTIAASLNSEAVFVDSATAVAIGLPEHKTLFTETRLSVDNRDIPLNPRSGIFFETFTGTGTRSRDALNSLDQGGNFVIHRSGVNSNFVYEFAPFWVANIHAHARVFSSDEKTILVSDLYRIGGARTVRGYREEQFLGDRAGWGGVELRYLLGEKSRVFGFADFAGIHGPDASTTYSDQYISSAGFGVRLETRLGVAGFDYGVGEQDHFLSGKVHASLSSQF